MEQKQKIFSSQIKLLIIQEKDLGDEYGWKQVHGDVFRPASHSLLFSALIGVGHQLTTVVFSVIVFAILGELYTEYVKNISFKLTPKRVN